MKALILFWTICLSLLFVSCEQSILEEPVIPKVLPVINASVSPGETISYNSSAVIKYVNKYTDKCTINDQPVNCTSGEFDTGLLTKTTSYTIISTGEGGTTSKTITISVIVPSTPPTLVVDKTNFSDKLNFGDKTSFSWKVEGEITSMTLNDIPVEKEGSKFTGPLFENTEFVLRVIGPGGERTEKLSIAVGDWTTSVIGLLSNKPWKLKEENVLNSKKEKIDNLILSRSETLIFTKEYKYSFYWDGKNVSSGDFILTNNALTFYDAPVEITKISKDNFIYIQKSSNNENYTEYIYVHE